MGRGGSQAGAVGTARRRAQRTRRAQFLLATAAVGRCIVLRGRRVCRERTAERLVHGYCRSDLPVDSAGTRGVSPEHRSQPTVRRRPPRSFAAPHRACGSRTAPSALGAGLGVSAGGRGFGRRISKLELPRRRKSSLRQLVALLPRPAGLLPSLDLSVGVGALKFPDDSKDHHVLIEAESCAAFRRGYR
jgi:hypothetical protein